MKPFQIFKPGRHTSSSGQVIEFTEDMLREAIAAYSPDLHEAPIVVGHPRDNGPAYGWVKALSFDESGAIVADPQQVDANFDEMVEAGRFKKRSASWYLPDSPTNPKPGTLYLRHVGFLGAQPPAVKGLKEVQFSEDEGIVEFMDTPYVMRVVAGAFRRLREWIIADKGLEAADNVLPDYVVAGIEAEANEPDPQPSAAMPAYSEEDPMQIEALQAQVATLTAERDAALANAKPADFAEREATLQAREAAVAAAEATAQRTAVEGRIDAAIKAGRLLPAQRKQVVEFAMGLAAMEATVDFGEGDKAEKLTQREAYLRQVEAAPKAVEYGELAPAGATPPEGESDPTAIAEKARDLVKTKAAAGKTISFTEAVAEVMATTAAE
jgi:hypothetical protein